MIANKLGFLLQTPQKEKWWAFMYYLRVWKLKSQTEACSHVSLSTFFATEVSLKPDAIYLFILVLLSLFFLSFIHWLFPNKSAACYTLLANTGSPSYIMIQVKCWQGIFYGLGVWTKKVPSIVSQNSLSDHKAAVETCVCVCVCVWGSESMVQASSRVEAEDRSAHV